MVYQNAERSQILTQIKIPSYQLMMMPERAREQVKRQYQELAAQMATEGLKMDQEAFQEHLEQSAVWEELKQELSLTDNTQGTEEIAEALFYRCGHIMRSGLSGITFYLSLWYQFWRFRSRKFFWWQISGNQEKKG